jgi:hypothetical protein
MALKDDIRMQLGKKAGTELRVMIEEDSAEFKHDTDSIDFYELKTLTIFWIIR